MALKNGSSSVNINTLTVSKRLNKNSFGEPMRKILTTLSLTLTFALASACLPFLQAEAKNKKWPDCSFRPTVAVDTFRTENIYIGWDEFAGNARDLMVNELVNSGCWRVVERGHSGLVSGGYDREQAIQQAGAARPGQRAARPGEVTLAGKLVQCALTGVTRNQMGGSLGGIGFQGAGGYGLGKVAPRSTKLMVTCRVYDSSTSEIVASVSHDKNKVDVGILGAGGGKVSLSGDFFYKTPLGKTLAKLIQETLIDLTDRVQKNPWAQ